MDLPPELQAIQDDRQGAYGPFGENMRGTSLQMEGLRVNWEACNPGKPLPPWWAALEMVAVKTNRAASGNYKQDNFDDGIVYWKQVQRMQEEASDGH